MKEATSRTIFVANQELNALCSISPHVCAKLEAFHINVRQSSSDNDFPAVAAALASSFPDYDFSCVAPQHFRAIESPEAARAGIAWALSSALGTWEQRVGSLWQMLEVEISPAVCRIYAYEPDCTDPFSQAGVVSNLAYFFVNRKQMRVVMFNLREGTREFGSDADDGDDDFDDDAGARYGYGVC
jgi:hypothetical protein